MKTTTPNLPSLAIFGNAFALPLLVIAAMVLAFSFVSPSPPSRYADALPAFQFVPSNVTETGAEYYAVDESSPRTCCDYTE
jgi:hypothetical protein